MFSSDEVREPEMLVTLLVRVSKLISVQLFVLLYRLYLLCLAKPKLCNSFTDEDLVIIFPFRNNLLQVAGESSELLLDLGENMRQLLL